MAKQFYVSVTDWTQPRGYKNSGRGWRVRCYSMLDDDYNALGTTVFEDYFRTEKKAQNVADRLRRDYNAVR